jgi:hypothetical protein
MKMLLNVSIPHEPFNTLVKNGKIGLLLNKILEGIKADAVYFTEKDGKRGITLVVNVDKSSVVPSLAEPWFLNFNADCSFQVMMTPTDLQNAGLEEIGKKWSS